MLCSECFNDEGLRLRIQDFLTCAFPCNVLELQDNFCLVDAYQKQFIN